jgi:hypothetical protein
MKLEPWMAVGATWTEERKERDWRPARGGEAATGLTRRAGHHSLSPEPGTRLDLDLTEHAGRMWEPRQGGLTTTSIRPLGPESCGSRMMRGCRPAGGTGKQTGGSRAKAARKKVGAGHGEDEYEDLGRKKKREVGSKWICSIVPPLLP